nr:ribonuclease H-like domain-containing protein [Tanacetum cinerariifolium]
MKMEHYLSHTDYLIWQVIQNGNGPVFVKTDTNRMIKVLPPKTAEEVVARERERKSRTTLLTALPEDHLARFHKMADAKEMWKAIKSRFGGNDESKKMQKYLLKQQFEGFFVSTSEGLHKEYDRFQTLMSQLEIHGIGVSHEDANQKLLRSLPSSWSQVALIMRTKPGLDTLSCDDLYSNLRVFERNVKGTTASSSNTQNMAFVSADNSSSTNDVSTAYSVLLLSQNHKRKDLHHTLMKPKWNALIAIKWGILLETAELKGTKTVEEEMLDAQNYAMMAYSSSNQVLTIRLLNTQMSPNDKFGLGYGDYRYGSILSYENEVLQSVFMNKASDLKDTSVNDRYANGMYVVPPPITGNYMPSGPDVEIDYSKFSYGPNQTLVDESDSKSSEYASCESDSSVETTTSMPELVENAPKVVCESKVWTDAPIIEEENVKETSTPNHSPKIEKQDRNGHTRKGLGYAFTRKACFVCGNKAHLADYQEFKGGFVAFRGSNGRITSKEKIKAGRLDFEDAYYVEELKHYNLFYVLQMCDKKNKVLFTNTDCLMLSPDFKVPDKNQKEKQHKASCKAKTVSSVNHPLQNLHMDLFGPTSIRSINHKTYCRVITNEAVNTACYVLNRVLVTKPHNKTPYELLTEEIDLHEEHFVLPIWYAYSTTVKSSIDKIEKHTDFKTCEKPEQIFLEGLEKLKRQETEANDAIESLRKEATHDIQNASTSSTNLINIASTPLSTAGPLKAFNNREPSYPNDPSMPHLEDIYASLIKGIFTDSSYDDEGVVTDLINLETTVNVSQTPTIRIHTIHPKTQILRDPMSAVQTKRKVNKNSEAHALDKKDIMLVQVYVDDIIFSSTKKSWFDEFEELMKNRFLMSSMGELTFFLGLQVKQKEDGIFISQDKYVAEILKKFNFLNLKTVSTPIETQKPLVKDEEAADVDVSGNPQQEVVNFLAEDLYYRNAKSRLLCLLLLQRQNMLLLHTDVDKHHFIRDAYENKLIQVLKIHTDDNVADLLTKAFDFSSKELASLKQTSLEKGNSNPLIVDSLLKTIWLSIHHDYSNEALAIPEQTATTTAKVKTINDEVRIQALIDEKRVNIKKSSIHRTLKLDDAEGTSGLDNADIFDGLANMGYEKLSARPLWHLQSFVLLQTRSSTFQGDMSHHKDIYANPSLTKKVFANMKRVGIGFSRLVAALFDNMLVLAGEEVESEAIDIKSSSKERIEKLKGRVSKLEEENRGRIIAKIDEDVEINLEEAQANLYKIDLEHPKKVLSMQDVDEEEPAEVEEVLEVVKASKLMTKVVTTIEAPKVQSKNKGKGILIEEPKPLKGKVQIEQDEAFSRQLEASSKENMIIYLKNMAGFKLNYFKGMTYNEIRPLYEKHFNYNQAFLEEVNEEVTLLEKEVEVEAHKREGESIKKEVTKKQKIEEEAEDLKSHLQIVANDDDDVYTEATPLASKIPIVDYKIHFERNKPYFKIIKVDGNHMLFLSFSTMLKNFDREDLESL